MATSTSNAPAQERPRQHRDSGTGLSFGRILKSEWIKVTTVPSTVILLTITVLVMVGLGALFAWGIASSAQSYSDGSIPQEFAPPEEGPNSIAASAVTAPTSGLIFAQLLIASLAVVLIASEWATGMIRSTLVAVPKRTPALVAKAVIVAVVSFVIGAVSALLSYLVGQPILAGQDLDFALTDEGVLASIINSGTFLALVAIISISLGILLRNTAGGIVLAVGVFFVLPLLVQIFSTFADWLPDAARFLPGEAGTQLVMVTTYDGDLTQWEGGLVMAAWALGLFLLALLVAKKRDV